MRRRTADARILVAVALLVLLGLGVKSLAIGFGFGVSSYTIDVSESFSKIPGAAGEAFDALDNALAAFGLSLSDRMEIRNGFEEGLDEIEAALEHVPTMLPLPHPGGYLEVSLPLRLTNGIRISGGYFSDRLARGAADMLELAVPAPLVEVVFDEGELSGSIEADLTFRSWLLGTEIIRRFDLLLAGFELAVGVQVAAGEVTPEVWTDVPSELRDGVDAAVHALHLEGFRWSTFGLHAGVGIELGFRFLRIGLSLRMGLPLSRSSGWWNVGTGNLGGSLGMVIRF